MDAAVEQVDELVTELDLSNDALLKAQAALEQVRGSTTSDQFLEELAQVSLYFQRKPLVVKRAPLVPLAACPMLGWAAMLCRPVAFPCWRAIAR